MDHKRGQNGVCETIYRFNLLVDSGVAFMQEWTGNRLRIVGPIDKVIEGACLVTGQPLPNGDFLKKQEICREAVERRFEEHGVSGLDVVFVINGTKDNPNAHVCLMRV